MTLYEVIRLAVARLEDGVLEVDSLEELRALSGDIETDDSKPDIYGTMTRRSASYEPAFSNPPRKG